MINPHLTTPLQKVFRGDRGWMLWVYASVFLRAVSYLGTAHAIIATMHGAEHFLLRESVERLGEHSDNFFEKTFPHNHARKALSTLCNSRADPIFS